MKIQLLEPSENTRAFSAAITRIENPSDIRDDYTGDQITKSAKRAINAVDSYDHISTREFTPLIFLIEDVSRVFSFWLMTESIHSTFEQQSQRYVKINSANIKNVPKEISDLSINAYNKFIKSGVPKEDARYVLPQGISTNFAMYTNLREIENLIRIFSRKKYPSEIYDNLESIIEIAGKKYPESIKKLKKEYNINDKEYVNLKINKIEKLPELDILDYKNVTNPGLLVLRSDDLEEELKFSNLYGIISFSTSAAHQFIRHREINKEIVSIGDGYIIPGSIKKDKALKREYEEVISKMFDEAKKNNSQYILPNAAIAEIEFSETFGHLIDNFIPLRTCLHAQWEIREIANKERKFLEEKLGYGVPFGRCRLYFKPSPLKEIYPTMPCPENDKECPMYDKSFESLNLIN